MVRIRVRFMFRVRVKVRVRVRVKVKVRVRVRVRVRVKVKLCLGLGSAKVEVYNVLWTWSCPFSIIVSKPCPNGCDVIWSLRQWRNWTSIWESEKRPYIWELDADLRIGRRLETGRRSESYIYTYNTMQL